MRTAKLLLAAAMVFGVAAETAGQLSAADDHIQEVKRLYDSAAYADALNVLVANRDTVDADQADEYQALCYLALGQTRDAEQTLERLVMRRPTLTFESSDRSPRLVSLYRAVRKRTLPGSLRSAYGSAKASYDAGQFAESSKHFKALQSILAGAQAEVEPNTFADLTTLTDGFLRLIEQRESLAKPLEPIAQPHAESVRGVTPPTAEPYGPADREVTAPIAVNAAMPPWTPPASFRTFEAHGILEIVIDRNGDVMARKLLAPLHPFYDSVLLDAAKRWKFTPATKDGQPVTYRKRIEVSIRAASK